MEARTHLVHRLVLVVPERMRGRRPVARLVDERDREDGRGVVEVVADARIEVVPALHVHASQIVDC